jgi:membrane protein DedA with SNARE-associated domain
MAALKILLPLLIFGALWFVGGTTATIFLLSENLDQITRLLIWAALTFVGVFALMLAWAFISLRNRNNKDDWSWNKEAD